MLGPQIKKPKSMKGKKLMKLQVLNAWTTQQHMITSITGERQQVKGIRY